MVHQDQHLVDILQEEEEEPETHLQQGEQVELVVEQWYWMISQMWLLPQQQTVKF